MRRVLAALLERLPVFELAAGHNIAGIGESRDPTPVFEPGVPTDMIPVQMRAHHIVHLLGLDPGGGQIGKIGGAQPVELRPLVDKVFTDLKERAEGKEVKLANNLDDLIALADAHRLEQVFANLVDNAIKYGRTQGTVTISGKKNEDGQIEVSVRDDGPGIPPEALDRVFERFYRVDKARSREQGGTGLGLSIVKHLVQNHGGEVWAKSEPGKGASFFFTLPEEKAEAE